MCFHSIAVRVARGGVNENRFCSIPCVDFKHRLIHDKAQPAVDFRETAYERHSFPIGLTGIQ